jgi:hypothetical protein
VSDVLDDFHMQVVCATVIAPDGRIAVTLTISNVPMEHSVDVGEWMRETFNSNIEALGDRINARMRLSSEKLQ